MMFRSRSTTDRLHPNHLLAACGSNPPFNYCGTKGEGATLGYTHDKQIAGSLRRCVHLCACMLLCKRSGSWISTLSSRESVYVSTGLRLCLEIDDCIRQQESPSESTSTVDTCSFGVSLTHTDDMSTLMANKCSL